jgi:hypothetical protein
VPLDGWQQALSGLEPPFVARPVASYVNVAAHEGPECLAPLPLA